MSEQAQEQYDWSQDRFLDKERLFVLFYIGTSKEHRNKTQAAIDAGYSKNGANKAGSAVSKRPHVAKAIEWYLARLEEKAVVNAERVVEELALIAFLDPREFFLPNGELKAVCDLSEGAARALASFDVSTKVYGEGKYQETETVKKVKFNDKIRALELLGKKFKMFTDKVIISDRPRVVIKDLTGRKNRPSKES